MSQQISNALVELSLQVTYLAALSVNVMYNFTNKFRLRVSYNPKFELHCSIFLLLYASILFPIWLVSVISARSFGNINNLDIINIALLIILMIMAKFISNAIDHFPEMHEIVKAKEPVNYSLLRQGVVSITLTCIAIIQLGGSGGRVSNYWLVVFSIFAISVLVNEAWEKIIPLRLSYVNFRANIENSTILNNKIKVIFEKADIFWFREISGSIVKSTVNCWSAFVILILVVSNMDEFSILYQNSSIYSVKLDGVSANQPMPYAEGRISTAFYVAAHEMFFNASGAFPFGDFSKIIFFAMHFYGLFLYSVFFVFGIQVFVSHKRESA